MRISKIIALVLLSSFIGIMGNPELLTASDSVSVTGVDYADAVETIEPEPVEPEVAEVQEIANYGGYHTTVSAPEAGAYSVPVNNIQIAGHTVALNYTDTTLSDAGSAIQGWYYASGRYIYAHNYPYVFGHLDAMYDNGTLIGTSFTVTWNGVTTTYTIRAAEVRTLAAQSARNAGTIQGYYGETQHAMALMTCYGDGSRLVMFAD